MKRSKDVVVSDIINGKSIIWNLKNITPIEAVG